MNGSADDAQEREWALLHDRIAAALDRFGERNAFRRGDYWLLDENGGWHRHQVEVQNLNLLKPHVIKALQAALTGYPDWEMTVRVDVPDKDDIWPGMGIVVFDDEIVDELQRVYLPEEFAICFMKAPSGGWTAIERDLSASSWPGLSRPSTSLAPPP